MDRRSYESPMDFEWQTEGPADITSPFYQLSQKQGQRRGFESPSKSTLPRPDTNTSLFTTSANTATPFRNPSFTTPRKPFDPDLFSEASGADSSPADNADAEDTPETVKTSTEMTAFKSGFPKKKPLFGRYGINFAGHSPGRGELRRGGYADGIVHKVRKRRRVDRDQALASGRRGSSDYESEGESRTHESGSKSKPAKSQSLIASVLSFIESKPTLPYVLSYYAQLLLNYFLVGFVIYLVWCFYLAILADVDKASEAAMGLVQAEMAQCASEYTVNRCGRDERPPAMKLLCEQWETCMNRDPNHVGRARVSAQTFAEIFNSFIEPISWKAIVVVVILVVVPFGINNITFSFFRAKASHPPPAPQQWAPPPTPSHSQGHPWAMPQTPRHPSQHLDHGFYDGGFGPGFHAIMPSQTPRQRSPRKGSRD